VQEVSVAFHMGAVFAAIPGVGLGLWSRGEGCVSSRLQFEPGGQY
jgi:hypothetical protein